MKPCSNAHWGCEGEVGDNATNPDCINCRAHERRWSHRKPTEVREWSDKVNFWAKRQRSLVKGKDDEDDKQQRVNRNVTRIIRPPVRSNVMPIRRRA